MLYRFSICRKGPPPCRFGAAAGVAGGLHLGDFRAAQLGFSLLLVLPAADQNSSSGNLIPNEASDLVSWDLQKNQLHGMNTPTNPSPPSLQPRQNTHHSHASQVLSYSFKPAAPIRPGTQNAQNQNSSSAKPLPPNLQGFKFGGLGFVGIVAAREVVSGSNPSPPHMQPPHQQQISASFALPLPHALPTGTSGGPPRRQ